jgi:hypothetical protein
MGITVNAVLPAGVNSDFIHNNAMDKVLRPDLDNQTRQDVMPLFEVAPPGCWSRRTSPERSCSWYPTIAAPQRRDAHPVRSTAARGAAYTARNRTLAQDAA